MTRLVSLRDVVVVVVRLRIDRGGVKLLVGLLRFVPFGWANTQDTGCIRISIPLLSYHDQMVSFIISARVQSGPAEKMSSE